MLDKLRIGPIFLFEVTNKLLFFCISFFIVNKFSINLLGDIAIARSIFSLVITLIITGTFYSGLSEVARSNCQDKFDQAVASNLNKRFLITVALLPFWFFAYLYVEEKTSNILAISFFLYSIISIFQTEWILAGREENLKVSQVRILAPLFTLLFITFAYYSSFDILVGPAYFLGHLIFILTIWLRARPYIALNTQVGFLNKEKWLLLKIKKIQSKKLFDLNILRPDLVIALIYWLAELKLVLDTILIGHHFSSLEVGAFRVAAQIQLVLYILTKTINLIAFRRASMEQNDLDLFQVLLFYTSILIAVLFFYHFLFLDLIHLLYPSIDAELIMHIAIFCILSWYLFSISEFIFQHFMAIQNYKIAFVLSFTPCLIKIILLTPLFDSNLFLLLALIVSVDLIMLVISLFIFRRKKGVNR